MSTVDSSVPITSRLTPFNRCLKRGFDIAAALIGLGLTWWMLLLAYLDAYLDTGKSGLFRKTSVGRKARILSVIKIRKMRDM